MPTEYHASVRSSPDDKPVAVNIRLDGPVHRALQARAAAERRSMNALINELLAASLAQPPPRVRRIDHYEETIRKLSGGDQ